MLADWRNTVGIGYEAYGWWEGQRVWKQKIGMIVKKLSGVRKNQLRVSLCTGVE